MKCFLFNSILKTIFGRLAVLIFFIAGLSQAQVDSNQIALDSKVTLAVDVKSQAIRIHSSKKPFPYIEDTTGFASLLYLISASKISSINSSATQQAALRASLRLLLNQPLVIRSPEINNQITKLLSQTEIKAAEAKPVARMATELLQSSTFNWFAVKGKPAMPLKLSQINYTPSTDIDALATVSTSFPRNVQSDFNELACKDKCQDSSKNCSIQITDKRGEQ